MKKIVLMGLALLGTLGFVACDGSSKTAQTAAPAKNSADKEVLYAGILPAGDAIGFIYTLKLDYDADHDFNEGDFVMMESGLASDTIFATGIKEVATGYSEGDFRKESKEVDGVKVEYIRLIPDAKEGLGATDASETYFIVNADGSLTMVGEDLQVSNFPGLNYTLTVK